MTRRRLIRGWRERDQMETNLLMLRNLLDPLCALTSGLRHISLLQGTKAYGASRSRPYCTGGASSRIAHVVVQSELETFAIDATGFRIDLALVQWHGPTAPPRPGPAAIEQAAPYKALVNRSP